MKTGQKVTYGKHGPGVIKSIDQITKDGVIVKYYNVNIEKGFKVFVPVESAQALDLKPLEQGSAKQPCRKY